MNPWVRAVDFLWLLNIQNKIILTPSYSRTFFSSLCFPFLSSPYPLSFFYFNSYGHSWCRIVLWLNNYFIVWNASHQGVTLLCLVCSAGWNNYLLLMCTHSFNNLMSRSHLFTLKMISVAFEMSITIIALHSNDVTNFQALLWLRQTNQSV